MRVNVPCFARVFTKQIQSCIEALTQLHAVLTTPSRRSPAPLLRHAGMECSSLHFFLAIAIRTAIINISTRNMRAFSNTSRMNNDVEMPPWLPPPPLYVFDRRIEGRIRKNLYIHSAQRHTHTQSVTREDDVMAVWA